MSHSLSIKDTYTVPLLDIYAVPYHQHNRQHAEAGVEYNAIKFEVKNANGTTVT